MTPDGRQGAYAERKADDNVKLLCRTLALSDSPTSDDALGGRAAIADAVWELVSTEPGGRAIGIQGNWGTGKSSIVRALSERAEGSKTSIIVFDAWAHEGDPLRRAFLETVVERMVTDHWVKNDPWAEFKKQLVTPTRTTTSAKPKFGKKEKTLAASAFAVPIGLLLIDHALTHAFASPSYFTNLVLGLVASSAPLWLYLALNRSGDLRMEIVLSGDAGGPVTTVEALDRTSVEFSRDFSRLLDDGLQDAGRRLVLVVDNLDRLTSAEAQRVWATIRTFLDYGASVRPSWADRVWVVVPYAEEGIRAQRTGDETAPFLSKVIQVRFTVPTPVLSNWRVFLDTQLCEAFPDHVADDVHAAARMLYLYFTSSGVTLTPRDVKALVNEIGVYHRTWQDQIPLVDIAYFILLTRSCDVMEALRSGELPHIAGRALASAGAETHLACLLFGVEAREAVQLLLEPPLQRAFADGDAAEFSRLEAASPGVWATLDRILDEARGTWDIRQLGSASLAIAGQPRAPDRWRSRATFIPGDLRGIYQSCGEWSALDGYLAIGLIALCDIVDQPLFSREVLERACSAAYQPDADTDYDTCADWMSATLKLRAAVDRTVPTQVADTPIGVSDAALYLTCSTVLVTNYLPEEWAQFRPPSSSSIVALISDEVADGSVESSAAACASVFLRTSVEADWTQVIEVLHTRLAADLAGRSDFRALLRLLYALRGSPQGADEITTLATAGWLFHHYSSTPADDALLRATVFCLIARGSRSLSSPSMPLGAPQGQSSLVADIRACEDAMLDAVVDRVEFQSDFKALIASLGRGAATHPFLRALMERLIDRQSPMFTCDLVTECWPRLRAVTGQREIVQLIRIVGPTELAAALMKLPFEDSWARLYKYTLEAKKSARFSTWCLRNLRALGSAAWLQEAGGNTPWLCNLAKSLSSGGQMPDLSKSVTPALLELAASLAAGNADTFNVATSGQMIELVGAGAPRAFLRASLLDVAETTAPVSEAFLEHFGHEIQNFDTLSKSRSFVRRFVLPAVQARDVTALRWLVATIATSPNQAMKIIRADDGYRHLRDRVSEQAKVSSGDESDELMKDLAKRMRVSAAD